MNAPMPGIQPYRPAAWNPGPAPIRHVPIPAMGQGAAEKGAAAAIMLIPTAIAGAVAYVGFRTGMRDKGFPQVVGYGVGFLGGLGVLGGLLAVLGIVALPSKTV